jgi:hypothetical protein
LRREFGNAFFGGIAPGKEACERFSDAVVPDARLCRPRNYLALLRQFPICVATSGLWKSNGWRLAEYAAQGKAIVTERLAYGVPGTFTPGANYLDFGTAEECVTAATRLMSDRQLRVQMSINNYHYYRSHVRPDSLVLNSLATALAHSEG